MEPIKQEIINNIFENGDKLITGPILQTVLIDMIDDVNVKDQEILSKTGSWDNAVTQIPNLATKEEVTNLSESVARDLENVDLTGYATEQWVQNQGYLKEHQDISNLATKTELTEAENNLQGNITSLSESVARDLANVSVPEGVATEAWVQSQDYASKSYVDNAVSSSSVDLTGYATETWVESQGYLKEHQDISNLATKGELNDTKSTLESNLNNLSSSVSNDIQNKGEEVKTWVQNQGYLKEHQDISNLATKTELNSVSQSVQTDITNLSESVANSAVWKKGEGESSIVQAIVDGTDLPTATGKRAIATGYVTNASGLGSHAEGYRTTVSGVASHTEGYGTEASGYYSHAEGGSTVASGVNSHAEGNYTTASRNYSHAEGGWTQASGEGSHAEGSSTLASGNYSHAEGRNTIASNLYEHAQGQYNHNSANQIFSVGAGEKIGETVTRRNAVSILEVPNSDTQVVTASFFVQNIGGYDGTNPEPGTNDLATVVSKVSSIWKKGEGTDSIVQVLTDGTNLLTATGTGSIATGLHTSASANYSHAEGQTTVASGVGSHAEGNDTVASKEGSHAEGFRAKALGIYSHAEGYGTTASGNSSHAEGSFTKASRNYSHAEGRNAEASGMYSHAEGYYTSASEDYSHTEGSYTVTSNQYEHAQGRYNHSSTNQIFSIGTGNSDTDRRNAVSVLEVDNSGSYTSSFFVQNVGGYDGTNPTPGTNDLATVVSKVSSIWKKGEGESSIVQAIVDGTDLPTATGNRAIATGYKTIASGSWSHAEGESTTASGGSSHAEGVSTKALKYGDHAEGSNTKASGSYSHAEGRFTNTHGVGSHAEGFWTEASGDYSHAEGYSTTTLGQYSHAEGDHTYVTNDYEHAQGRYNYYSENQIFSIGTGTDNGNRRNAVSVLEVDNSGSYTSSFFVQNVGGYDGTNPTPGTNDLATVLNNTETWTFTLEDGSTVTKTIRIV